MNEIVVAVALSSEHLCDDFGCMVGWTGLSG